ncbi:hypothetical protein BDZ45DRAFT_798632 [Acephala macrosclerotiorum]|nr:hypothetical protein BDZ45DRAFT_798632 [Acephala macrosclerotiorum]
MVIQTITPQRISVFSHLPHQPQSPLPNAKLTRCVDEKQLGIPYRKTQSSNIKQVPTTSIRKSLATFPPSASFSNHFHINKKPTRCFLIRIAFNRFRSTQHRSIDEVIRTNNAIASSIPISDARQQPEISLREVMGKTVDLDETIEAQSDSSTAFNKYSTPIKQACPTPGDTYKTYDNFQLFPKLPIELRLKIRRFSFPEAKHVSLDTAYGYPFGIIGLHPELQECLEHPLPIGLHVNQESRSE